MPAKPRGSNAVAGSVAFRRAVAESVRTTKLGIINDPGLLAGGIYQARGANAVLRLMVAKLQEKLSALDFGVVGDGVTDDTIAMQNALAECEAEHKLLDCLNLCIRITGPLVCNGPGIIFDDVGFGSPGDAGIFVDGTGFTALTVTGRPSNYRLSVYGTGNTANGIYFNNPIHGFTEKIRVYNLDGFHVKIDKCFDCVWGPISMEVGGNVTDYMFSVNDAGDTSNQSHFLRIQAERGTAKVINIDANTLNCIFDDIHSEQANGVAGHDTWALGGHACEYNTGRFTANVTSPKATLHLVSADSEWTKLFVEDSVDVTVEAAVGIEETVMTLNAPRIQGTLGVVTNQQGKIQINGGNITALTSDAAYFRVTDCLIKTLTIGFTNNPPDPKMARFVNCDIGTLVSNSTLAAATFIGCQIAEGNSLLRGATTLVDSTVTCAATITHSSGTLLAVNSTITAAISYVNNAAIRLAAFSRVTGTVSCGDGGSVDILIDSSSTIGASSTGVGIPTAGPHNLGDYHKNAVAGATSIQGWQCTTAGTPGTFTPVVLLGGGGSVAATSANTPNTLVERDGSGNFAAGTITAALTGNADTATTAATATTATAVGHKLTVTTGKHLTWAAGTDFDGSAARALETDADTANTPSTIVARDANGDFAAHDITQHDGHCTGTLTVDAETHLGNYLKLHMAFAGGTPVATGYLTVKDSGGTIYKVLVGT